MEALNASIAEARGADLAEVGLVGGVRHFLSFRLGGDNYALDVSRVEVVLEWCHVTRVPKAPEHMRGVINHRGSVVPVVDLSRRLGMGPGAEGEGASIIVMEVAYEGDRVPVGVIADSVDEVVELEPRAVERAPEYGTGGAARYVSGMTRRGDGFMLLLDIDRVFEPAAEEGAAE